MVFIRNSRSYLILNVVKKMRFFFLDKGLLPAKGVYSSNQIDFHNNLQEKK